MPFVEVSDGELFDKWTILEVKRDNLKKNSEVEKVLREIGALSDEVRARLGRPRAVELHASLLRVNTDIWMLMEQLYGLNEEASLAYVEITLSITELNKQRAYIKRSIDEFFGSVMSEAKSYF